jgi:hypothetical protein
MAWRRVRTFNNLGQQGNAAGVFEAAVCLWIRRIRDRFGRFNWESSTGDWVPTPVDCNTLYNQFYGGQAIYLYGFMAYLAQHVYQAGVEAAGNMNGIATFFACSHYPGLNTFNWTVVLNQMAHRDVLNLSLASALGGHSVGV